MRRERPAKNNCFLELHVPDFKKAKKFYGQLGFKVVWERPPSGKKGYLVVRHSDNILCFWAGNQHVWRHSYFNRFPRTTKRGYAVEIIIMSEEIGQLYRKAKRFAKVVEELQMQPWGLRDFRIEDPFGFYIRFTEPHNILDRKYAVS